MRRIHLGNLGPPARPPTCARLVAYRLLLLVLAALFLPAACDNGSPLPASTLAVPDCTVAAIPGLTQAPAPPSALDAFGSVVSPGATAGTLPGSGSVTPTGEYRYRIPLDVPPGRAGMAPSLALTYSSRGKNGHLGVGWQIEGLSEIARCPRTFAVDGVSDGVRLDEHDALCLDGHELVAIGATKAGGCAGQEYRTEGDTFAQSLDGSVDLILGPWNMMNRLDAVEANVTQGGKVDGVPGAIAAALNTVNPFDGLARSGVGLDVAIEHGDVASGVEHGIEIAEAVGTIVVGGMEGGGEGSFARGPAATLDLAQQIANVEKYPMNFRRTVSLLETQEGPTLVSGGATDLSPAQVSLARQLGFTPVPDMPGFDAEPTAINGAGQLGLTPTKGVTTSIICDHCQFSVIEPMGGRVTSDYTYEF